MSLVEINKSIHNGGSSRGSCWGFYKNLHCGTEILVQSQVKAFPAKATVTVRNAYRKHSDYLLDVGYLMLATMSPFFRTRLINTNAYNMIRQLRDMFQTQARTERYDDSRALNACKMAKGDLS
ncbi:hypothetical protein OSB04_013510 [Centaurea solstitialis]|uniref:Uncharacterized protein n=1 Tax=Centaurea solstitialis TaxID=347529 RepID=A0AA38TP17_9ASTR|nr:hypothetical protein OSB04_013510 [Centaurea solstitialis]